MSRHPSGCAAEEWIAKHWPADHAKGPSVHCRKGLWVARDYGPAFTGVGVVTRGTRDRTGNAGIRVRWYTGSFSSTHLQGSELGVVAVRLDQCRPATAAERTAGLEAQILAITPRH